MAWRGRVDKNAKEKPWVRYDFPEAVTINRLRLSANREYFYDTDYLTQKPYLPRYEFDLDVMKEDGTWQPLVGTSGQLVSVAWGIPVEQLKSAGQ